MSPERDEEKPSKPASRSVPKRPHLNRPGLVVSGRNASSQIGQSGNASRWFSRIRSRPKFWGILSSRSFPTTQKTEGTYRGVVARRFCLLAEPLRLNLLVRSPFVWLLGDRNRLFLISWMPHVSHRSTRKAQRFADCQQKPHGLTARCASTNGLPRRCHA